MAIGSSSDAGLRRSGRPSEMAGFTIFQPAYDFVDGKLDTFLTQDAGQVMAQVAGPLSEANRAPTDRKTTTRIG